MAAKLRLVFTITILFASFWGYSQDNYWAAVNQVDRHSKDFIKESSFSKSKVFSVNENMLNSRLKVLSSSSKSKIKIYFPDELGLMKAFYVQESSVFAPELAAKYPGIKSYSGYGAEDLKSKIRFSISHKGVQVMMVHPEKAKATFIQKTSDNNYVVYSRNGLSKKENDFICKTESTFSTSSSVSARSPVDDMVLRKYRLAVAASGEYTEFHGGTVADALAAINATVTRVNQVFETDLGVTLELIPNNDVLIYTDGETDPFSAEDNLTGEIQTTLTSEIGAANYDLGHLFHKLDISTGSAGFIGEVCTDDKKGSGFSAGISPVGDTYDIDFVAHEIGHQLGANHTYSHINEGTGVQVEPGSGTTIMGYAGITGINNVALNSDAYFNYVSILQITENLAAKSCGETISIVNNPPAISPIPDYTIPVLTAFKLTGEASDPDAGDQLSYAWEQIDNGVVTQSSFGQNNPQGANFRSLSPTTDPSRYFPAFSSVISGNVTEGSPSAGSAWETTTAVSRDLNFAFTVRDNAIGGGQVVSELIKVEVREDGGAFSVISQASNADYTAGELLEVNWNVARTDLAPINVQTVDILLSVDGGLTFPIVLGEQVINDGSHAVLLPGSSTNEARIMVRANENIFYAVNAANFAILESAIVLNPSQTAYEVCQPDDLSIPFVYETYAGFSEEVTFEISDLPAGVSASFSPATAITNDTQVVLSISNTANADVGSYTINLSAVGVSQSKQLPLPLLLFGTDFPEVNLLSPADGSVDVSASGILEWQESQLNNFYEIQIATDIGFTSIVETATVFENSYNPTSLVSEQSYFWRVREINSCGEGSFGSGYSFTTIKTSCMSTRFGTDLPIVISGSGTPTITSKVIFFDNFILADIDVGIELDHTYLSDLIITLTSPLGKSVRLVSNSCGDLVNINAVFDDSANSFDCSGFPGISGTVSPVGSFDSFLGDSIAGEWTLTVEDTANMDGGSLKNFFINVCVEGEPLPDEDGDGVFDTNDSCPGTPSGINVDITGCPIYRFATDNFELKALSESCRTENDGVLEITTLESLDYDISITGNGLNVNDTFTTSYIQNNLGSGVYSVCFNATDGDKDYEEACFEFVITEPEALSVSSRSGIDPNSIVLSMSGSDLYTITLNGMEEQTTSPEFTLKLAPGKNVVKVTGNLVCQGSYEEQFFIASGIIVYPNPATNYVKIFVENADRIQMNLYAIDGRLIRTEKRTSNSTEVELDVSALSAGTYFLKVESEFQKGTYKIIKE